MKSLRTLTDKINDNHISQFASFYQSQPPPMLGHAINTPDPTEKKKNQEEKLQHRFQLRKMEIKDPEYMSEVPIHLQNSYIPGFPTTIVACGEPGSGKTNLFINLLTREDMWKGFFDRIYFLGPTIKSDKLFKHLKIPEDQIVTEQSEFIPKLVEWTNKQIDQVEHDPEKAPKCLFYFEDITSYYHTAQSSPDFAKCFNAIRHHKATAYANIHKLKALNRTARMACRHVIIFPVNKTEIDQVYDDYGPKTLTKWDFYKLCEDAWTPDEWNQKPFLYINKYAEESKRFRKNFTHIINVKLYEGVGRPGGKRKQSELTSAPGPQASPSQPQPRPKRPRMPPPSLATMRKGAPNLSDSSIQLFK